MNDQHSDEREQSFVAALLYLGPSPLQNPHAACVDPHERGAIELYEKWNDYDGKVQRYFIRHVYLTKAGIDQWWIRDFYSWQRENRKLLSQPAHLHACKENDHADQT